MTIKKFSFLEAMRFRLRKRWFIRRHTRHLSQKQPAEAFLNQLWQVDATLCQLMLPTGGKAAALPISLVLGLAESGKSTFLSASHGLLKQSQSLKSTFQPMVGCCMPRYLLTLNKLYIEMPQYLFVKEVSAQLPYLEQLLHFWQASGEAARIKQIIITVRLSQLLNDSADQQEKNRAFWSAFALLCGSLPQSVMISVVLTECDRVQGFTEFFADLSVEELRHACGVHFDQGRMSFEGCAQQLALLIERLRKRMWWRCHHEHLIAKRVLAAEFPDQFQMLIKHLLAYLKPLLMIVNNNAHVHWQHCFFLSLKQYGNSIDLLTPTDYFTLAADTQQLPMLSHTKTYFVHACFQQLMLAGQKTTIAAMNYAKPKRDWFMLFRRLGYAMLLLLLAASITSAALYEFAYMRLEKAFAHEPLLSYKILTSHFDGQNLKAFVSYELPFLQEPLQKILMQKAPVRTWVRASAHAYLNQRWQTEIYTPYLKNIMGKYPIALEAKHDLSLTQFNDFYGPGGVLIKFKQNYLQNTAVGELLQNDRALIDLYGQLTTMQQLLYAGHLAPHWSMHLYPDTLAPNVKTLRFMVAGKAVTFKNHALVSMMISWPNDAPDHESGYFIEQLKGLPELRAFSGDFSWLKLLSILSVEKTAMPNTYRVRDAQKQFSIMMNADRELPLLPTLLASMPLPEKI